MLTCKRKIKISAELENNKQEYAREGKYSDAEQLKEKIDELKKSYQNKRKKDLELQHYTEIDNLEQAFRREVDQFNREWSAKFHEYEEYSKELELALTQKHTKEMEDLYVYLEQKLPKNVKHSKEYLSLKHQEEKLVKIQQ
jgi:hypothetical protein